MGFSVNFENIDPDNINGMSTTDPGLYHFQVESWYDNKMKGAISLTLTIIGTEKGKESAIGRTHREMIFYSDKQRPWAEKKVNALFVAAGNLTLEDIKKARDEKISMDLDFDNIVGKTFVGRLSKSKDKDGNETRYNNLNFDYYTLDSEEAKSVQLHPVVAKNSGMSTDPDDDIFF